MIPASPAVREMPRWQAEMARAITQPAELLRVLALDPALLPAAERAAERFPLRVPRGFVARMRRGDPDDPLLRQVLPLAAELDDADGFGSDPVGDLAARAAPGLLHKYAGRALLVVTAACGVHCRYCFRRDYPYADSGARAGDWRAALEHITADTSIREIILSGGDPLALANPRLRALIEQLDDITHLQRLRIHSRQPVVLPERIDDELLEIIAGSRLQQVMVLHVNHANEIDAALGDACRRLRQTGITLLNQAVLLAGVNDSVKTQSQLCERLFAVGVLPYYLHLLDRVQGAAHYEVPTERALTIMELLRAELPGFLVPRLVREEAGAAAKSPVYSTPEPRHGLREESARVP